MPQHDPIDGPAQIIRRGYMSGDGNKAAWLIPTTYVLLLVANPKNIAPWTDEEFAALKSLISKYTEMGRNL